VRDYKKLFLQANNLKRYHRLLDKLHKEELYEVIDRYKEALEDVLDSLKGAKRKYTDKGNNVCYFILEAEYIATEALKDDQTAGDSDD
jgi:hypothetical protein